MKRISLGSTDGICFMAENSLISFDCKRERQENGKDDDNLFHCLLFVISYHNRVAPGFYSNKTTTSLNQFFMMNIVWGFFKVKKSIERVV